MSQIKNLSNFSYLEYLKELKENGLLKEITRCIRHLCEEKHLSFSVLQIDQCDAGVGFGISFDEASCLATVVTEEFYPFASVFEKGLNVLNKVLHDFEYVPKDNDEKRILEILFKYLTNKDCMDFVVTLQEKPLRNETQLAIAVAEHMFSMLTEPGYVVNNHGLSEDIIMCRCGCEKILLENLANTSIGHRITWHGYLDIIVGMKDNVLVKVQEISSSPCGDTSVKERKKRKLSETDLVDTTQQIIAQTIVYSFLQKQKHPDLRNFLIPCIGITFTEVTLFLFDCENDILLKSRPMLLNKGGKVNYELVMALWLSLNYKYFGTGLSERLKVAPKARFFEKAKKYLHIYRDNLSQGDVNETVPPPNVDPCRYPEALFVPVSKFIWPDFD